MQRRTAVFTAFPRAGELVFIHCGIRDRVVGKVLASHERSVECDMAGRGGMSIDTDIGEGCFAIQLLNPRLEARAVRPAAQLAAAHEDLRRVDDVPAAGGGQVLLPRGGWRLW